MAEVHIPTSWITLGGVHEDCGGERCVIHNPSDHHMRYWRLHWRGDRGIFERICPCGIGHPDPDQFDYWKRIGQEAEGVHGCCGCCDPGNWAEAALE